MTNIYYSKHIRLIASYLLAGEVIAIPTETVYGLAAMIDNEFAVRKIFDLKNRPINHPLIVHVSDIDKLLIYSENLPEYALKLAEKFFPGPLTLVCKKSSLIKNYVTGNQNTVGIRIPDHPITLELLKEVGCGLAAPSANKFGKISPTEAQHVINDFGSNIKVLDGGKCKVGLESTILDVTDPDFCVLLRPGMIPLNQIQDVIGKIEIQSHMLNAQRVSGNLKYHYAPDKPSFLYQNQTELKCIFEIFNHSVYVLHINDINKSKNAYYFKMPLQHARYANLMYQILREADKSSFQAIAIELPNNDIEWQPIIDKLLKLSAYSHERYKIY